MFVSNDDERIITVYCSDLGYDPRVNFTEEEIVSIIDATTIDQNGMYSSKSQKQLLSGGTWNCYEYPNADVLKFPGTLNQYVRISGSYMQLIMIYGNLSTINTDEVLNVLIK